jgi:putative DNA primase/helicase
VRHERGLFGTRHHGFLPSSDHDAATIIDGDRPGQIHYAATSSIWHIWDGRCQAPDTSGEIGKLVQVYAERWRKALEEIAQDRLSEELVLAGGDEKKARAAADAKGKESGIEPVERYVSGLLRTAGHQALVKMLQVLCSVDDSELDERHPGWLNFANGTVDLATGVRKPHDPADMITYCLPYDYDPAARCPEFIKLGRGVCGGDEDVFRYLMTVLGYCLLGDNREQLIFFIDGPTKSGKSTLLEIVTNLLGPLAHASQATLITHVRHGRNARTMNSIRGKRLITITETSAFMVIDEGQVKMITGESHISVDQHYAKSEIKTPVTWVIVVATNQMPSLTDFDPAMRERVVVIPGGPTIAAGQRDRCLASLVLEAEAEGVLAALVAACVAYHQDGLAAPLAISVKTDEFASQQNTVANFLADCCTFVPPGNVLSAVCSIPQHDLWERYEAWSRGSARLGKHQFLSEMGRQPGISRNETMRRFEGVACLRGCRTVPDQRCCQRPPGQERQPGVMAA